MTLSEHLAQKHVTALGLAKRLGVSHSTVLRWAADKVPADRVIEVAKIAGISPRELRPDLAAAFAPTPSLPAPAETAAP